WLSAERLAAEMGFWRATLSGESGAAPALVLTPDRPRPAAAATAATTHGGRRTWAVGEPLASALAAAARGRGVTLFMRLLAAFDALLLRHSGESDLAVGTPVANRDRPETQGLIGLFVNTLVLRVDAHGDPTFASLAERVRRAALAAYSHQDLPFERLVSELAPRHGTGEETPRFQTVLALQPTSPDLAPP